MVVYLLILICYKTTVNTAMTMNIKVLRKSNVSLVTLKLNVKVTALS